MRSKFTEAVVYGAAAALGSALVSLVFEMILRKSDAHHIQVPQDSMRFVPEDVRLVCLYPNQCSISVVP